MCLGCKRLAQQELSARFLLNRYILPFHSILRFAVCAAAQKLLRRLSDSMLRMSCHTVFLWFTSRFCVASISFFNCTLSVCFPFSKPLLVCSLFHTLACIFRFTASAKPEEMEEAMKRLGALLAKLKLARENENENAAMQTQTP